MEENNPSASRHNQKRHRILAYPRVHWDQQLMAHLHRREFVRILSRCVEGLPLEAIRSLTLLPRPLPLIVLVNLCLLEMIHFPENPPTNQQVVVAPCLQQKATVQKVYRYLAQYSPEVVGRQEKNPMQTRSPHQQKRQFQKSPRRKYLIPQDP